MHKEILSKKQKELLILVKEFKKDFGLVGGTSIALYLGHRRSIDFDLFSNNKFDNFQLQKMISKLSKIQKVLVDKKDEYTVLVKGVKVTFLHYPYKLRFPKKFSIYARLPDLLTLAAMKAYALGRRAKWKDYIDLFFLLKEHFSTNQIVGKCKKLFCADFNDKNFRTQLAYFKDIDHSEEIIFLKNFKVSNENVEKFLVNSSLDY